MGRYDFRPLRVHQTVTEYMKTPLIRTPPPWLNIVRALPPAQILIRPQPAQLQDGPRISTKKKRVKKPSRLYKPVEIVYPEDALRRQFFSDHPWELARPRVILEEDGKDSHHTDWSRLEQPRRPTDGESVVQRQRWLLDNQEGITPAEAYDQARKEFYEVRHEEDVERRVAKEEALAMGARFGKSYLEVGMELEDRIYEKWRAWAHAGATKMELDRSAMYSGGEDDDMGVSPLLEDPVDPAVIKAEREQLVQPVAEDEGDSSAASEPPGRASPLQETGRTDY